MVTVLEGKLSYDADRLILSAGFQKTQGFPAIPHVKFEIAGGYYCVIRSEEAKWYGSEDVCIFPSLGSLQLGSRPLNC